MIGSGIVAAAVIVAAIVVLTVFQGAGALGCPAALLEGDLVEDGGTLAVRSSGGALVGVDWPLGYGVGTEDGRLVLTRLFVVVARPGDRVSMGGGEGGEHRFRACGPIAIRSG